MKMGPKMKGKSNRNLILACLAAGAFAATGCGFGKLDGATEAGQLQLATAGKNPNKTKKCGDYAFATKVHPILIQNCSACHSPGGAGRGYFAGPSAALSYPDAIARVNVASPGSSLLVAKGSSTHSGCTTCNGVGGNAIAAGIGELSSAQAGTNPICANLPASGGSVPYFAEPEETNSGGDSSANGGVQVIAAGLDYFSANVKPILRTNCNACHRAQGVAGSAPFGVDDAHASYIAAKPRARLGGPDGSDLYARAGTVNHGPGCSTCGPALAAALLPVLEGWSVKEAANDAPRIDLAPKLIGDLVIRSAGQTADGFFKVITWSLPDDMIVKNPSLQGSLFTIKIRAYYPFAGNTSVIFYQAKEPRLLTSEAQASIQVNEFIPILNGNELALETTYKAVDAVIPPGRGLLEQPATATTPRIPPAPILSPALLTIDHTGGTDTLGFSFNVLRPN